jgi:hypothetical protein
MLWKVIFIVVYVKMGSYMTIHGKLHDNVMAWHGLVKAWKWKGMKMAWHGKAWKWHDNGMEMERSWKRHGM